MTNIYLVRHAHSTYTPDELNRPLSEEGMKEAQKITEIFKGINVDLVLSSPYRRAIQTVEGIADEINKEVITIDEFKERKLAGEPVEDFKMSIEKVWSDYSFAWEGGESNNMAQKRGINALKGVLKKYQEQDIVLGTHGNIMVLMMNYYDEKYDFEFWQNLEMPDIYKLSFDEYNFIRAKKIWNK